ncbi:MAG TPA: hypothetical protein PLL39_10305, partial [Rhodocyclaceae bacterium]|nr:hypothetical protein [Rhodocyclaceae bacterium]
RRYGAMTGAYLEQKTSAGGRVSKRRTAVAAGQMGRLERVLGGEDGAASGDWGAEWGAEWFLDGVAERGLKPAALTVLRRAALPGLPPDALSDLSVDDAVTLALSAPLVR